MPFKRLFCLLWLVSIPVCVAARPLFEEPWGQDAGLKLASPEERSPSFSIPIKIADAVIRFHQQVISPVDGPRSSFRPTSSRYMQLAMQRYGFVKGFLMGCDRLLRENDDEWVYKTIEIDGKLYKFDPAFENKHLSR
jgi:hypothetical protein